MQKEVVRGIKIGLGVWLALIILLSALAYYAWNIEPHQLTIRKAGLNLSLEQTQKIVFIADLHVNGRSGEFLEQVADKINSEDPDYIFLGGDFVEKGDEVPQLSFLKMLKSGKGIYAVLGNHDYYLSQARCTDENGSAVASALTSIGIKVLRNDNVDLGDFILVGVDDHWACKSDYPLAMEGVNFTKPLILLVHNQEAIPEGEYEKLDLVLAGHTHCGQVRIPLIGSVPKLVGFKGDYDAGLHQFDNDSYIYTTCGIAGGPRFLAPPEITVIELE